MNTHSFLHNRIVPAISLTALCWIPLSHAETLTYEGFDIPAGELDNESGATSFGWRMDGGEQITWWTWEQSEPGLSLYHAVTDEGLTFPGLPTVGGAFMFENEAQQGNVVTHRFIPGFIGYYQTGERWLSALINPKIDGDPTGGGWFQLCLSDPLARHGSIYMGISNNATRDQTLWSGGGERVYIDGVRGEKWSLSDVPVEDGVTVFVVMQLDLTNKTAAWWINPPVDADDPGEPVDRFTILTDLYVDRVMLRIFNNGPSQLKDVPDFETQGFGADYTGTRIDEIRIGTTYASVAGGATVKDPNGGEVDTDPPVITGPSGEPGDATAVASVVEGRVQVGAMTANEPVSWSISGGADGTLFSIGAGTGGLSFRVPPIFAEPTDADGDNVYVVEVRAEDLAGNTATQTISVTVLFDDTPPMWAGLVIEDGTVDTGEGYLGLLTVEFAPWLYSELLGAFVYLPESHYDATGSWVFITAAGNLHAGGQGDWYWSLDLETWILIPDYSEGNPVWGLVFPNSSPVAE